MESSITYIGRFLIILVALAGVKVASAESDALLSTPKTPENTAKGMEIDAYQLGVAAYVYGYPLVRMENVMRDYIQHVAGIGTLYWAANHWNQGRRLCARASWVE